MAKFGNDYRRVLDERLPMGLRFGSFVRCVYIGEYRFWREGGDDSVAEYFASDPVTRFLKAVGVPPDGQPTAEQLVAAVNLVREEREVRVKRQNAMIELRRQQEALAQAAGGRPRLYACRAPWPPYWLSRPRPGQKARPEECSS